MMFAMEAFDEQELPFRHTAVAENLSLLRNKIALEGMTRDDAQTLETICPGIFDDRNLRSFTVYPSNTLRTVALESIDFKRMGIIAAAAAAAIFIITSIFKWLSSLISKVSGSAGAIKNVNKTNDSVNRASERLSPVSAVSQDVSEVEEFKPAKRLTQVERQMTKGDSLENNYLRKLATMVEEGKVSDADAGAAAREYVVAISRHFNLTDRDKRQHLILGKMLLSKSGTIPLILNELEFVGGGPIDSFTIARMDDWLAAISDILRTIGVAIHNLKNVGRVEFENGEYVENNRLANAIGDIRMVSEKLVREIDKSNISGPRGVLMIDTTASMSDSGLKNAKYAVKLPEVLAECVDRVRENSSVGIGFWTKSDYQHVRNVKKVVDVSKYVKAINVLMSAEGLERLGHYHSALLGNGPYNFQRRLDDCTRINGEVSKELKELTRNMKGREYLTHTFKRDAYLGTPAYEVRPLEDLNAGLSSVGDIIGKIQQVFSALLNIASSADAAVRLIDQAAKD